MLMGFSREGKTDDAGDGKITEAFSLGRQEGMGSAVQVLGLFLIHGCKHRPRNLS